jgi:DNA uptake protein ComE-like DNA-binding protein
MVDSIQDMLEEVSKMQNEQMPALLDTIRDQIGMEQADQFKASVGSLLASMVDQLGTARESADQAARALAGEQVAQPMAMGAAPAAPMPGAMPADAMGDMGATSDLDSDTEAFAATDAAAGPNEIGREKR